MFWIYGHLFAMKWNILAKLIYCLAFGMKLISIIVCCCIELRCKCDPVSFNSWISFPIQISNRRFDDWTSSGPLQGPVCIPSLKRNYFLLLCCCCEVFFLENVVAFKLASLLLCRISKINQNNSSSKFFLNLSITAHRSDCSRFFFTHIVTDNLWRVNCP